MDATSGDRPESPPFPLPSGRRHPSGLERIYSCPVSGSHAPLQNVQSDSIGYIPKRKACIVKLDGCRFTIGRYCCVGFSITTPLVPSVYIESHTISHVFFLQVSKIPDSNKIYSISQRDFTCVARYIELPNDVIILQ